MSKHGMKRKTSKRMTCSKKYKILKKVREFNRKKKKDDATNKKKKRLAIGSFSIPNKLPFKERILLEAETHREHLNELMETKKLKKKNDNEEMEVEEEMVEIDEELNNLGFKSTKKYNCDVGQVLKKCDVILEVLDARDPLACRCYELEERLNENQKLIFILNKIDLIPKSNIVQWLQYLRREHATIAFKSSEKGFSKVEVHQLNKNILFSGRSIGVDHLFNLLYNYSRIKNPDDNNEKEEKMNEKNEKKKTKENDGKNRLKLNVGVIGYPNVGKSSVINSLKRSHICTTGNEPGVTRQTQEIKLSEYIRIIDTPGVILNRNANEMSLVLQHCLNVKHIDEELAIRCCNLIVSRVQPSFFTQLYQLPDDWMNQSVYDLIMKRKNIRFKTRNHDDGFDNYEYLTDAQMQDDSLTSHHDDNGRQLIEHVGLKRGRLMKGGRINTLITARGIIGDWITGKIRYFTSPPEDAVPIKETKITTDIAPLFDFDEFLKESDNMMIDDIEKNERIIGAVNVDLLNQRQIEVSSNRFNVDDTTLDESNRRRSSKKKTESNQLQTTLTSDEAKNNLTLNSDRIQQKKQSDNQIKRIGNIFKKMDMD
ncbi:hypothetical protein SNEBB_006391 [Seison nebaliae]|nr:hypothetical protein SNEBB_006391 [Seison nebaliae]